MQLCWLALLLIRTAEIQVGDTWRKFSHILDMIRLVILATDAGTVTQRTRLNETHISRFFGRSTYPNNPATTIFGHQKQAAEPARVPTRIRAPARDLHYSTP